MIEAAHSAFFTNGGRPRKEHVSLVRQEIKEWKCSKCGSPGTTREIHVHHSDRNPKNGKPENLELLCRKCHTAAHKEIGPSLVPYVKKKTDYKIGIFIDRFDSSYSSKGGFRKLKSMCSKGKTLQSIGSHFGVTRERVRQWLVAVGLHKTKASDPWDHDHRYPYYEYRNREWDGSYLYALKRYIKSRKIAKYKLAEELGVKPEAVYLIFRNRKFLAPDIAQKLIEGSGGMVTREDLMMAVEELKK